MKPALDAEQVQVVKLDPWIRPVDAFRSLATLPHVAFLDSGADLARCDGPADYSIVAADPFALVTVRGAAIEFESLTDTADLTDAEASSHNDPFNLLDQLMSTYRLAVLPDLPFRGGAIGYLGYDLCHFVERLPHTTLRDIDTPDAFFALYDIALVFDHRHGACSIVSTGFPRTGQARGRRAIERAEQMAALVSRTAPAREASRPTIGSEAARPSDAPLVDPTRPTSNFTRGEYLAAIETARDYIFAGDVYQVNLSQRFEVGLRAEPVALYEILRRLSPAPFGAYIDAGDFKILSNSPEQFLWRRGDRVQTRPIKGTMPRRTDRQADRAMAERLRTSEKDGAEHLMIVDLERNDLGRVCTFGSVVVDELAKLESFRNVHHLTSMVSGKLRPEISAGQLLRATFPGGSITGAPKVRAMQIIDELEPTTRGIYTGAIGYLSFCGTIDLSIAIRTLIHDGATGYFQVGGGIVADSDPASEYDETIDKAGAFFELLSTRTKEVSGP